MNLIDQSVEQVDFALRRRFPWIRSDFDPDALMSIFEAEWRDRAIRVPWERVQLDFQRLAAAGTDLNEHIHASPYLALTTRWATPTCSTHSTSCSTTWGRAVPAGRPSSSTARAIRRNRWRLWRLSLLPLLEQYLAGLDAPTGIGTDVLVDIFLARRSSTDDEGEDCRPLTPQPTSDQVQWLREVAALAADDLVVSLTSDPRHDDEPIVYCAWDGTWWAGRYVGTIHHAGQRLTIAPRFGLSTLRRWISGDLGDPDRHARST